MDQPEKIILDYYLDDKNKIIITRHGEPVAVATNERDAFFLKQEFTKLQNDINSLEKQLAAGRAAYSALEIEYRACMNELVDLKKRNKV